MRSFILLILVLGSVAPVPAEPGRSFTLESADGSQWTLPDQQDRLGIYLFWASWCPYCQALMPHLQSVVDELGGQVTVYALNFRDEEDPVAYIDQRGFDFVVFPKADEVAESWGVRGTPAVYLIDRDGNLCFDRHALVTGTPEGWEGMGHRQRAQRRAPYWAARLRETLDGVLEAGGC